MYTINIVILFLILVSEIIIIELESNEMSLKNLLSLQR